MPGKGWDIEISQYGLAGEFILFAVKRFNEERQKLCCSSAMSPFCLSLHGKGFRPVPQHFLDISSTNNSKEKIYFSAGDRNLAWQHQNLSVLSLVLFHNFFSVHHHLPDANMNTNLKENTNLKRFIFTYHLQGIVWYQDCCNMLVLAGMALIFLTAAWMVLCFGFVSRPTLIIHQYLGKCPAVFVQH